VCQLPWGWRGGSATGVLITDKRAVIAMVYQNITGTSLLFYSIGLVFGQSCSCHTPDDQDIAQAASTFDPAAKVFMVRKNGVTAESPDGVRTIVRCARSA
jgi:hypothetical protein